MDVLEKQNTLMVVLYFGGICLAYYWKRGGEYEERKKNMYILRSYQYLVVGKGKSRPEKPFVSVFSGENSRGSTNIW